VFELKKDYKDGATMRKERIETAYGMLKVLKEVKYDKAVALLSFNLGLSARKSREYIQMLRLLNKVETNDGTVKVK